MADLLQPGTLAPDFEGTNQDGVPDRRSEVAQSGSVGHHRESGREEMSPKALNLPDVQIPRIVRLKYRPFLDYFKGFEDVEAVRGIFGPQTKAALRRLKVEFF